MYGYDNPIYYINMYIIIYELHSIIPIEIAVNLLVGPQNLGPQEAISIILSTSLDPRKPEL